MSNQIEKQLQDLDVKELKNLIFLAENIISEKIDVQKRELKKTFEAMAQEIGLTAKEIMDLKATPSKVKIKYKKGNDTWTGRGRRPAWVVELQEKGEDINDYLA